MHIALRRCWRCSCILQEMFTTEPRGLKATQRFLPLCLCLSSVLFFFFSVCMPPMCPLCFVRAWTAWKPELCATSSSVANIQLDGPFSYGQSVSAHITSPSPACSVSLHLPLALSFSVSTHSLSLSHCRAWAPIHIAFVPMHILIHAPLKEPSGNKLGLPQPKRVCANCIDDWGGAYCCAYGCAKCCRSLCA